MNIFSFLFGAPIKPIRNRNNLTAAPNELADFKQYYQQHLEPLTSKFENARVASLKSCRQRLYLCSAIYVVIVALAFMFMPYLNVSDPMFFYLIGLVVLVLPFAWWVFNPIKHYKTDVKQRIYPLIFKYFGHDFIFCREHKMSLATLKASKLLPYYDAANFDDYVQGTYTNIEIAINELHLTKQVKRDKNTDTVTVFKGVMIELSSHKDFRGHTVVVKSRGGLVNFLSDSFKGLERVKLEDPIFEKQFDVFSTDQIEARYLLTVSFMERLQELSASFGNKIQCAFYRNKLLIMLGSKENRFEMASIFKPATFEYEFSQINKEMKQLFAIVDVLQLEQKTGL
ncbi:DUF3137 domain-containing protein [Shewanella schlegeliana]|uniref:DUF3137 domain-containing protein n=1 Tax=Shewanella schlegeliana TaxID=190308 RepID=A0ABS1T1T7_9GAMM|nr:DUF3137 domain-containing protein [Shewanella schlegeliana]MBL4914756.1 DUF3137 domain-containing protein [Shewanella schlegeliana]MCL1109912.1 DUF3137 domain-containing protein [Shewanella schlegeliana]GIU25694.1 Galanin [Shewanella schlegeliana]